jgi:CRISPR-associated protein (TIGR03984 family)
MSEQRKIPYTITNFPSVAPEPEALLQRSGGQPLTAALIFSPDRCRFARIDTGVFCFIENDKEQEAALTRAYEIRAFGSKAELRWLRDGSAGTATLLVEETPGSAKRTGDALAVFRRNYLLWGRTVEDRNLPPGWSALAAPRIGKIHVPCPAETGQAIRLTACEYVVRGKFGNAIVLFERLAGFAADGNGKS